MDDQLLQLAFAVYHNPGVYALLLGSGVSRSASIPTGWEVMNDLIGKIALGQGEQPPDEPYLWYREKYGEEPGYDTLLQRLGITPFERKSLLQAYFEPTEDERKKGIKTPRPAHTAIAKLVKSGHIRVVLTTNFDRLLEKALEAEGIVPDVASTPDALKGLRPLQHSPITIIKLHGDYRDGRIKNTAQELAKYDSRMNKLLDRILDEYGLIVCGWSAEWDEALRNALSRAQGRRYTTYWAAYGELKEDAQRLVDHRQAETVQITGADDFFYQLQQGVTALQTSNQRHPLSIPVAVERVKKLLPNPEAKIELRDLFQDEAERTHLRVTSKEFYDYLQQKIPQGAPGFDDVAQFAALYFQETELAVRLMATLCWYGDGHYPALITNVLNRWIEIPKPNDDVPITYLPTLFLMYAAGIAALRQNNWAYLQAIFYEPIVSKSMLYSEKDLTFLDVIAEKSLIKLVGNPQTGRTVSLNRILRVQLRPVFEHLIPSDTHYSYAFDLFEMTLSLAYLAASNSKLSSRWMPPHSACYKGYSWDYIKGFWFRGGRLNQEWGLLGIEPFLSKQTQFLDILTRYVQTARLFQESDPDRDEPVPDYVEDYKKGRGDATWESRLV